jgi:hypothetical protein
VKLLTYSAVTLLCLCATAAAAQETQETLQVPSTATEAKGFIPEPDPITRAVLFADRQLGKGDLTNGIYLDYGNMIPGAGWGNAGPGYRHWYAKEQLFIDGSASISVNNYRLAQGRIELPALLKSRLVLGVQGRWQNFPRIDYFGEGPDSNLNPRSVYSVQSAQFTGYASIRPMRWLDLHGQISWMNPESHYVDGPLLKGLNDRRTIVPTEVSLTLDTRDFPDHPTRGIVLRGVGADYKDRTSDTNSFRRYEAEAATFLPIGGGRAVFALHGWGVKSELEPGHSVPLYLEPSLGGVNTLRSFTDYRFRDDNMLLASAELRLALMTHIDFALFADAGNVAKNVDDLNLDKRSYGGGIRLHTRRFTFASVDAADGAEGWKVLFRLRDPLQLWRLTRKTTLVPFVP